MPLLNRLFLRSSLKNSPIATPSVLASLSRTSTVELAQNTSAV